MRQAHPEDKTTIEKIVILSLRHEAKISLHARLCKMGMVLEGTMFNEQTCIQSSSDYPAIMGLCCFRIIKYDG